MPRACYTRCGWPAPSWGTPSSRRCSSCSGRLRVDARVKSRAIGFIVIGLRPELGKASLLATTSWPVAAHTTEQVLKLQRQADKLYELGEEEAASKTHKPNMLNTVIWLVETAQQVSVMLVNYKGRPWMKGATENPGLLYSLDP